MSEPNCPACGSAMFGWAKVSRRPAYAPGAGGQVVDRCESCGLGLLDAGRAIDLGAALGGGELIEGPNRSSLQAALGARGWAAIDPVRRVYPTPAAAEPIAKRLGGHAAKIRTPPGGVAIWSMWQTLVNAFTLGDNVISDARHGRHAPASGRERAALALDLLVSALVALPLLIVAAVLETVASLAGRGGVVRFKLERQA